MARLPVGTVTFLLTDIEGSTRLVKELGRQFPVALDRHHAILRRVIAAHRGVVVSTEGDAFFAVFEAAGDAADAAVAIQRELASEEWPAGVSVRVRIGLHTGDAELGGDNYTGIDVHRAARIAAAGHGGQVLISEPTRALLSTLPGDVRVRDVGRHRLKDLTEPEHLHQLVIDGLEADFPPLRTIDLVTTNIVAPATSLIGRGRELRQLTTLLDSTRLLTLTGPGGTGKTRLATELGTRAAGSIRDGVFLVPLEHFVERSPAAAEIGRVIGARLPSHADPEDNLVEHCADRELILLLDNLEQLVGVGSMVSRLLAGAPHVRVVATSRIPLHVAGEQEYPVPPLDVPGADATERASADDVARIDAVALFVDRARRARPDFRVSDDEWRVIAAICRRLDGLPLAIELAAARVKLFAPEALLARLDRALPLLAGGSVDLPARQQTLRGAIDWSCTLLAPGLQALFRRLAVFSGGWTVEAAEEVARPASDLGIDVVDGLSELVDHSLVRSVPDGASGESRFDMLQLIREFAAERLAESEDAEPVARRHADWVLGLAEAAAPIIEAGTGPAWLDRLGREHDNIRTALRWAIANDEQEKGLRTAASVWRFWQQRGHGLEGRQWFDRLWPSEAQISAIDPAVIANAHTAVGGLAYWQNELEESGRRYRAALEIDRRLGRDDRLGNDVYNLGFIAMFTGDLDGARRSFEESAELFRAAGQRARLADTTTVRGAVELRAGKPAEALPWTLEGRRLNVEAGNISRATDAAMVLSYIHLSLGHLDVSEEWLETAIRETSATSYEARWPLIFDVGMALAFKRARPFDALRLAAGSARRRERHGGGAPTFFLDREGILAEARTTAEALDPAAAEGAWAEGDRLGDDELIALIGPQGPERPQS